jgi:ferredoxin-NADP reductase
MAPPTRGFLGRRRPQQPGRLPPGQYDVGSDWPVLTAEVTPLLEPQGWMMTVDGLVDTPRTWTWDEAHGLPQSQYAGDIHCVTTWSKFDTLFDGVSVDVLLDAAGPSPDAAYVLATSTTGYTTNLPLSDVTGGKAWVVWAFDRKPLPREHGGPVRLLAPHVFRLTAEDGYSASRSYSVASPPSDPLLEFYIERLVDGEVSGYLAEVVEAGDELDLRGPIGGWFVWEADVAAVGIAGGTGVVPLIAMLRHARDLGRTDLLRILVSARTLDDVPYPDELNGQPVVLTRADHAGRVAGRVAADDVRPLLDGDPQRAYVCGSAGFAESASRLLVDLGVPTALVRVERFGPTG